MEIYSSSSSPSSFSRKTAGWDYHRHTNETPHPRYARRRKEGKKKGKTRRNEEKKAHIENEAPGKKQEKRWKDRLQGSAWTRLAHPNLVPHPHASPLPPQKWPTPQSTPKPPTQRIRESKAGASALFNTISTLAASPNFFFKNFPHYFDIWIY